MRAYAKGLSAFCAALLSLSISVPTRSASALTKGGTGVNQQTGMPPLPRGMVGAQGEVSVYGPGGSRFDSAGTPHGVSPSSAGVSEGDPCEKQWISPVNFTGAPGTPTYFVTPAGSPARTVGGTVGDLGTTQTRMASYNDAEMHWKVTGKWVKDDHGALNCQVDSKAKWEKLCDAGPPDPCLYWHSVNVLGNPRAVDWGPYFAQAKGQVEGQAGHIGTAPPNKGVVNLPQCVWLEGQTIPDQKQLTVTVSGPPDGPGGRAVFYTLVVTIQFIKTYWDFDDPWDDSETAPAPQCGVHDSLTAHDYREISENRHEDQKYHVVAHEHYGITAEVFYLDSYGMHHDRVPTGLDDVVISTEPRPVYVGQIEAIPITPTR